MTVVLHSLDKSQETVDTMYSCVPPLSLPIVQLSIGVLTGQLISSILCLFFFGRKSIPVQAVAEIRIPSEIFIICFT